MALPLIKILLIIAIAVVTVLVFRGGRRASFRLAWRVYGAVVGAAAIVAVLLPDLLTHVARAVGVGRGADFLLYILVVTFMFVCVVLFRRVGDLERGYTELARLVALQRPLPPVEAPDQAHRS
jgi:hypothetical protein